MSKIQTIIYLFVFLIVFFSMDTIFGNPLRETFTNSKLSVKTCAPVKEKDTTYAFTFPSFKRQSDDQPLHFSFPNV